MWQYFKAIRPMPGFHVDQPPSNVRHSAVLFATIRNNGRILDDVRCVLGGNEVVEASFQLGKLMENPDFKEYEVEMQRWPRDIELQKGLVSGAWTSLSDLVARGTRTSSARTGPASQPTSSSGAFRRQRAAPRRPPLDGRTARRWPSS
jgi:hypothetical protein